MLRSLFLLGATLSLTSLSLFSLGCGGDDSSDGPVASTPLKGTINGAAWTAKEAIAKAPFNAADKERTIEIYSETVGCNNFSAKPKAFMLLSVPWTAGYAKGFSADLSGSGQTATFVVDEGGTPQNTIATTGRVELIEAPTDAKAKGKLRIRAIAGEANEVEGEIAVTVCPASG